MPRIRTRTGWIVATLTVQTVLLAIGFVVVFRQVRHAVVAQFKERILESNVMIVEELGTVIEAMELEHATPGSEGWRKLQRIVASLDLPADGFACILDEEGRIICHPEIDAFGVRGQAFGAHVFTDAEGRAMTLGAVPGEGTTIGHANLLIDGTHYIATKRLPSLGIQLVVHQPERGLATLSEAGGPALFAAVLGIGGAMLGATCLGTYVISRRYDRRLESINAGLEDEVASRIGRSLQIRNAMIFGLAKLADHRDADTGTHLERICVYVGLLAEELRDDFDEIDDAWIDLLKLASSMHDIGKVGVPDASLQKPGRLDEDERASIERHTTIGADTLLDIRRRLGDDDLVDMSIQIALQHHERWDGRGYPLGLKGEQIALPARLVALADFYDALTSKRVYKPACAHDETVAMIADAKGAHFDPVVVDAFLRIAEAFADVRSRIGDPEPCAA